MTRSPAQVGKVLKRLGLKRRKVGALPGKAVTEEKIAEQETFQEQQLEPRLAEAKAGQRVVFFRCRALCLWGFLSDGLECGAAVDPNALR